VALVMCTAKACSLSHRNMTYDAPLPAAESNGVLRRPPYSSDNGNRNLHPLSSHVHPLPLQVADPLRHFVDGLLSLNNPIGSVGDKVNVGIFRYNLHNAVVRHSLHPS
jgi:hypothetical protein